MRGALGLIKDALTEWDSEVAHLCATCGGGAPHGITGMNGMRGSHHYFLDLTREEASMVVATHHGIIGDIINQLCYA